MKIPIKNITRKHLDKHISRYRTADRVLDIGAGLNPYSEFFPNRVTLDIDESKKPDFVGDIYNLPFKDESESFILCTEVLEHLENPPKAIKEMQRVLKKDGVLILTTRFVYPLHGVPRDYFRFSKYALQHLFREWDIVEICAETPTFSAIGALVQRSVFQTKLRLNRPMKFLFLCIAWAFDHLNWLIVEEYGHIDRTTKESMIMTTGYFVAVRKR